MVPFNCLLIEPLGTADDFPGQGYPQPEDLIHECRRSQRFPILESLEAAQDNYHNYLGNSAHAVDLQVWCTILGN